MEIEKVLAVAAPADRVWSMLLDPNVMGSCVPGMKSIEVISDVEYIAHIHVKISFISAKFKLKTTIVEQRAPNYLRCEGTGEDASVASSLKQQSEIFLTELPDGQTELRIKVKVDVLGRLGAFGLSVMKTKADRMWDEFGQNLVARLNGGEQTAPVLVPNVSTPVEATVVAETGAVAKTSAVPTQTQAQGVSTSTPDTSPTVAVNGVATSKADVGEAGWWSRLLGGRPAAGKAVGRNIRIDLRRGDTALAVEWPVEDSRECAAWLREVLR